MNNDSLVYMSLWFAKVAPAFAALMTNEKVVARQEFLASFDQFPHRLPVAAYSLDGLSAEEDVLIWRVSPDLEDFQVMSTHLRRAGFGRFLEPARSIVGTVAAAEYPFEPRRKGVKESGPIGNSRFLTVASIEASGVEALQNAARSKPGRLHLIDGRGLCDSPWTAAYESEDPLAFSALFPSDSSLPRARIGVRKEIHDLVESAG